MIRLLKYWVQKKLVKNNYTNDITFKLSKDDRAKWLIPTMLNTAYNLMQKQRMRIEFSEMFLNTAEQRKVCNSSNILLY